MILVDTSVWIDHLRSGSARLAGLLERSAVLSHPSVTGEIALGRLKQRRDVLGLLNGLPQAVAATPSEVLTLIERHELHGMGIGYVEAQLLAATRLTSGASLWSNVRRLEAVAQRLGCAFHASP